ncbi:cache domain-containing sensor histidine kinase [Vallitalea okinawensis]|uniref:cache domain-containing sensor histidine kinase n=1 Tax=Vallitalea okinawensis TaxID=2078660 RepID=UPI0013001A61|nr:sensor histidine kinase [Vallitalea okinawensis]
MKKMTLSTKLFKVYIIFYSLFFSTLLIVFGFYIGNNINEKLRVTQEQLLESMNKNIENFFVDMNDFSMTLVNSKQFKEITIRDLPDAYSNKESVSGYFKDLYLMAYKMIDKEYQVGIYDNEGHFTWLGNNYFITETDKDHHFYKKYTPYGQLNIDHITEHPIVKSYDQTVSNEQTDTIAVIRTININNLFHKPEGYIEVHAPYNRLVTIIEDIVSKSEEDIRVYLFDENGRVIYGKDDFIELDDFQDSQGIGLGRYRKEDEMIYVSSLLSSNLYMVTSTPRTFMNTSLKQYLMIAVCVFILLNLLLMFITYRIAIKITTPLNAICNEVDRIELDLKKEEYNFKDINTDIYEIDVLKKTLKNMQEKLRASLEEIIQLESFEVQSKLIALQSQIKPHFMYNTLMTIDALSQEQEHDKVSNVCHSLTSMLRYISTDGDDLVLLSEEVRHVDQYVTIMKERFSQIDVEWDIPLEMMDIYVPKLILQPLVENSLKYKKDLGAHIKISGSLINNFWRIKVLDDGNGFDDDTIHYIMELNKEMGQNYREVSLEIDGMGLPNIYIRLQLLYGESMYFRIHKEVEEGSCIEIGGKVER